MIYLTICQIKQLVKVNNKIDHLRKNVQWVLIKWDIYTNWKNK